MKPYKRKIYFIDRRFQTKYIFLTIVLLLAYTLALITMVFLPYVFDLASGGPPAQQEEAARTLLALHGRIWPGVCGTILLFSVLSIYISHQVAGPVYRIKKGIQTFLSGDLTTQIHLRRRDDLKDLAECANRLRSEMIGLLDLLQSNQTLLDECRREMPGNGSDAERIVEKVTTEMARNQEILAKYRTS